MRREYTFLIRLHCLFYAACVKRLLHSSLPQTIRFTIKRRFRHLTQDKSGAALKLVMRYVSVVSMQRVIRNVLYEYNCMNVYTVLITALVTRVIDYTVCTISFYLLFSCHFSWYSSGKIKN
jgi:hypothetical protein